MHKKETNLSKKLNMTGQDTNTSINIVLLYNAQKKTFIRTNLARKAWISWRINHMLSDIQQSSLWLATVAL